MAIARMLKVTVFAHQSVMDGLVARMQRASVLDIVSAPAEMSAVVVASDDERVRRLQEYLADATFVRDFLGKFHEPDHAFASFVAEKIHMDEDAYLALSAGGVGLQLYRECEEISSTTATLEREKKRLRELVEELALWEQLHLQIARWRGTEHVVLFTGIVPAAEGATIRQALRDTTCNVSVEELASVKGKAAWVVMAHRDDIASVRTTLALTGFQDVDFPDLADYPAEERSRALERVSDIHATLAEMRESAHTLASAHYHGSVALVQAIASQLEALTVRERFGSTDLTFAVRGWVQDAHRGELAAALEPLSADVDLTLSDPAEGDAPPVVLTNPRLIRPFEVLTNLYGLPRYGELDPTPLLAPFFLAFFAICIGDVGYGLMLIAGAWYFKNKVDVAPGVKQFMDLMMVGGAGAMVAGVLFGSYFALDFEMVKNALPVLGALQILDPLRELPTFLIVTIVIGMVQVFFGVLLAAYNLARRGDKASAFFDQVSTLLMFAAIGVGVMVPALTLSAVVIGVGVTVVFKGRALEAAIGADDTPAWDRAFGLAWIALVIAALASWASGLGLPLGWAVLGVTVVGLGTSRAVRRSVVAVLGGLYAVYSMTSFIGDILSYTRLAALGLSGLLVGMVFNTLAGLVMGGAAGLFAKGGASIIGGVVVVVLATLVFAVGHVFNVVINLLGAFVHPARLQFVEFFSKFYQGGGRSFSPFAHRTKSLVLHAGEARQEGAGS